MTINPDVVEMSKCTNQAKLGTQREISCKLSNWSVSGPDNPYLVTEALRYFVQYRSDGVYNELLGRNAGSAFTATRVSKKLD